jgi:hypothetical protein
MLGFLALNIDACLALWALNIDLAILGFLGFKYWPMFGYLALNIDLCLAFGALHIDLCLVICREISFTSQNLLYHGTSVFKTISKTTRDS